jgi:hypothetical protein
MARRVILHVGTKKTGTTYLQTVMWNNREVLRHQGVLVPGERRGDHLNAALEIREADLTNRGGHAPGTWNRLLRETHAFEGTAVISHEIMGAATATQVEAARQALEPAEIHVVVTARDYLATFPALWQERIKFRSTVPLSEFDGSTNDALQEWGWPIIDTVGVLERWGAGLPPERIHVIPVPPKGAPRDELWRRFAGGLLGVDPTSCDTTAATDNSSLGVVEVELLRKVNSYLGREFRAPRNVGRWLRTYLAGEVLAPRHGDRFSPGPEQEALLRKKSVDAVEAIKAAGYDVIGDVEELLPPAESATTRHPDDVTPDELADASAATIARLLVDLNKASEQRDRLRATLNELERRPPQRLAARLRAAFADYRPR